MWTVCGRWEGYCGWTKAISHHPRNPEMIRFPNVDTDEEWFQPGFQGAGFRPSVGIPLAGSIAEGPMCPSRQEVSICLFKPDSSSSKRDMRGMVFQIWGSQLFISFKHVRPRDHTNGRHKFEAFLHCQLGWSVQASLACSSRATRAIRACVSFLQADGRNVCAVELTM